MVQDSDFLQENDTVACGVHHTGLSILFCVSIKDS